MYQDLYDELLMEVYKSGTSFIDIYKKITPLIDNNKYSTLLFCGMGGSGIGANYIQFLNKNPYVNVTVNKNYLIPKVNENTLAIVVSYSGNTEETIEMFNQLFNSKAGIHIISSGGKITELADKTNIKITKIPKGLQPRAAFPYILGALYGLTQNILQLDKIDAEMEKRIISSSQFSNNEKILLDQYTRSLITDGFPIIVSAQETAPVGLRFRCQLNENSKLQAFNFSLPEFSHNGIVSFDGNITINQNYFFLPSNYQHKRTEIHFKFMEENIINDKIKKLTFKRDSKSYLEELLTLTWSTDYISIKAAEIQNINPIIVPSINKLKKRLKMQN